jgi:hypothetical protein
MPDASQLRALAVDSQPAVQEREPSFRTLPSIVLTVGGIGRRPEFGPGRQIESRERVCLTLSVDHDVVNGAPLARFISRFRDSVETAALLKDESTTA